MGGDLKKIQTVGNYFVEVWKAVGMEGLNEKVHTCQVFAGYTDQKACLTLSQEVFRYPYLH